MKPILVKPKSKNYLLNLSVSKKLLLSYPEGRRVLFNSKGIFLNLVIVAGFYLLEQIQRIINKNDVFRHIQALIQDFSNKIMAALASGGMYAVKKLQICNQYMQAFNISIKAANLLQEGTLQILTSGLFYMLLSTLTQEKMEQIEELHRPVETSYKSASFFNIASRFESPARFQPALHLSLISEVFKIRLKVLSPSRDGMLVREYGDMQLNTLHLLLYNDSTGAILYPKQKATITALFRGFLPFFEDYIEEYRGHSISQDPSLIRHRASSSEELEKLKLNAKPHQRRIGGSLFKCQNCHTICKSKAQLTCEHVYCKRCIHAPQISGTFIRKFGLSVEGREKDCLMPGCLAKLEDKPQELEVPGRKDFIKQIEMPVCSSCGLLEVVLELQQCKHKFCHYCVTAFYHKSIKSDRCPFSFCRGRVLSYKVIEDIIQESNCKACHKYIVAPSNPRCFLSCPHLFCDACLDKSFTKDWKCKTCERNHKWLQGFYENLEELKEGQYGPHLEQRWGLNREFPECDRCKKGILGRKFRYEGGWMHLSCRSKEAEGKEGRVGE